MPLHFFGTQLTQFGDAPFDPFPPPNVRFFTLNPTHQVFDLFFFEAKLRFDGLERRAVLPRHHDDSVGVLERKFHFEQCRRIHLERHGAFTPSRLDFPTMNPVSYSSS
jgi:hypothetical protein